MMRHAQLSDNEYQVLLQILETERSDLHPEVRRSTMNFQAHEELQQRLRMVEDLIQRLQKAPTC